MLYVLLSLSNVCELQNSDVMSPKPCLSLSTPFSWDATTFSVPASTTQTSDTDSDAGFNSHNVCLTRTSYVHTHTRLMALFPGLPRWAGTRKVKPIVLKQETVSGSGISWDICKSAPRFRHVTMPAPLHSVFYRLDALPAAQPVAVVHWWMHLLVPCLTSYCSQYLVV